MRETTSDKVLRVLELFGEERVVWTVEDAAEELGLPTSTTYRYFRSLAKSELITTYVPGKYVLGPAVIEYDRQMRLYDPLITAAKDEMIRLAEEVGPPTQILLTRLYHRRVMCVHLVKAGMLPFHVSYERGRRMPLDRGAAGKVVLAHLGNKMLTEMFSDKPDEELATLRKSLQEIKTRGFSMTEAEIEQGARGLSVPVFGPDQRLEGSLSVVIELARPDYEEVIKKLIRSRKLVEANLAIGALVLGS